MTHVKIHFKYEILIYEQFTIGNDWNAQVLFLIENYLVIDFGMKGFGEQERG